MKRRLKFIRRFILTVLFFLLSGSVTKGVFAEQKKQTAAKEISATPQGSVKPMIPVTGIPRPVPTQNIAEIQRELQEIVQIHRALQAQHINQIQEIQRITEQAKIHQELLKNLAAPLPVVKPLSGVNIEETLRLQKIRLIEEETRRNRAVLENLQKKSSEEEKAKPKTPATSPNPSPSAKEKPKKTFWW